MAAILLVDDDPDTRWILEATLVREGHAVSVASGGREALQLLDSTEFDLLITDVVMPDVEGLEVLRQIRRKPTRPRIITMSGGGRGSAEEYLELATLFGSDATLAKPFSKDELIDAIDRLLGEAPGKPAR